ncbi:hypothetical protein PISL3812_04265 [Talaromyces islandicus]|uniref:Mmc1 C-terminal domain-containing protein n=1 Tax=Talaromyces islandicus TaxID=28573 RepID=A0A0U1LV09_TALIS|nr:hypothetical protein PISL3812_04265 [Talaromyces islandicus]
MPARIRATVSKSVTRLGDSGASPFGGFFFCPSCWTWRRTLSTRTVNSIRRRDSPATITTATSSTRYFLDRRRCLSSLAEVNRNVPMRNRELYALLGELHETAADQISLSRLQLAQRGLESEVPVIRVAVLGLNGTSAARRLVRLLLADPLTEKQSWEDLIESHGSEESRGLLIRYGQNSGIVDDGACPMLSIPSPVLKNGNIEILVGAIGTGSEPTGVSITEETLLVPTLSIPTSSDDTPSVIQYPVHKTVICGSGPDGLFAYSGLLGRANLGTAEQLVHGAIELASKQKSSKVTFVDTAVADTALAKFRESVQFVSEYERGWTAGGVQDVVNWLSAASVKKDRGGLAPELQVLVQSLLDSTEKGLVAKEAARLREQEASDVSVETRQSLEKTVSVWAERAHTELQKSLEEGFSSLRWRGLAWWKLFWRVDDVGAVTSEILQTRYLAQAEKEMIWAAGRVKQTGLLNGAPNGEDFATNPSKAEETADGEKSETTAAVSQQEDRPWPMQIAASRSKLGSTTIPSLQALSQSLVLFSASTTGLTSAFSALLYSSSTTGLYEACTVAAVGLIYSLRRQQSKWEKARSFWEDEVRETGRKALIETENVLRESIRDGPTRSKEELPETRARGVVARARKALEDAKQR